MGGIILDAESQSPQALGGSRGGEDDEGAVPTETHPYCPQCGCHFTQIGRYLTQHRGSKVCKQNQRKRKRVRPELEPCCGGVPADSLALRSSPRVVLVLRPGLLQSRRQW